MEFKRTKISGLIIIEPKVYEDERGCFFESFNSKNFAKEVQEVNFVQDNESKSKRGVLRGLHFQKPPFSQAKLVRCIKGKVLDIAVDIRKDSSSYGKYIGVELSEDNKRQLFIPRGFAHGFVVLSKEAVFSYKVDNWYTPDYESGIIWNDKDLNIDWQFLDKEIFLSKKDSELQTFRDFKTPF